MICVVRECSIITNFTYNSSSIQANRISIPINRSIISQIRYCGNTVIAVSATRIVNITPGTRGLTNYTANALLDCSCFTFLFNRSILNSTSSNYTTIHISYKASGKEIFGVASSNTTINDMTITDCYT